MMTAPNPTDPNDVRAEARTNLLLGATIESGGLAAPVKIRDLSENGALLDAARLPPPGERVSLLRGELSATGTVMWRKAGRCGLHFHAPIDLKAWLPSRVTRDQREVDRMVADVRAGREEAADADRSPAGKRRPDELPGRLSEEIAYVARQLIAIGDNLSNEPVFLARYGKDLQNLDISSQVLGHIARILTAEDQDLAIGEIGMVDLRKRLRRKSL